MAAAIAFKEKPPLPMDCAICTHDEDKREEWGCDEELKDVPDGLRFSCFKCSELRMDRECPVCGGSGEWGPNRCPRKLVGWREMRICEHAVFLEHHLPGPGGWEDQPHQWHLAIRIVLAERASYEEQSRKADESKRKTGAV